MEALLIKYFFLPLYEHRHDYVCAVVRADRADKDRAGGVAGIQRQGFLEDA